MAAPFTRSRFGSARASLPPNALRFVLEIFSRESLRELGPKTSRRMIVPFVLHHVYTWLLLFPSFVFLFFTFFFSCRTGNLTRILQRVTTWEIEKTPRCVLHKHIHTHIHTLYIFIHKYIVNAKRERIWRNKILCISSFGGTACVCTCAFSDTPFSRDRDDHFYQREWENVREKEREWEREKEVYTL